MTFLSSFETKEYLLPHLALKEVWGEVSDSTIILTLSVVHGNLSMDVSVTP